MTAVLRQVHMQVQWGSLSPQQLTEHARWTYVDPKDGEYVRPVDSISAGDLPVGDILLSTQFRFRDGTENIGFVHGTEQKANSSFPKSVLAALARTSFFPADTP